MKPIASSSRDTTSISKPAAAKESEQCDLVDPETLSCVTNMPDFIYLLARFYNHCPDLRI